MILFELVGRQEEHPIYQDMEISNGARQYDFLRSIVTAAINVGRPFLSAQILKALNFQAIACLHTNAGEYRPCQVVVGTHKPPEHYRVDALMDDFINQVNRAWETTDTVVLSTFVLWRMNYIHPFINGNGRTARAACYFVLCVKANGWLPGKMILPELIRRERDAYIEALADADKSFHDGNLDLTKLHQLVAKLLEEQINGGTKSADAATPAS
ncbi:MAG TPA: Fic family protein [Rhodocyclaceae bacterium]|jgi:fido (protein-threonine AMPylation protein)|nr:Fic family protein [Rhodocyclaceae bacterium]HMZ55453.1 Fic family protein [Nitrospira sp.]HNM80269.1 Fic family protein [Rhodocyclaceae bacterium]